MSNAAAIRSISHFAEKLRRLPRTIAIEVAKEAAPILTEAARATFDKSQDAYGVDWDPGVNGQTVTLVKSGSLKAGLYYVAIGTKLRVRLPVSYAKYQVGKRPVHPRQGEALPLAFSEALSKVLVKIVVKEFGDSVPL